MNQNTSSQAKGQELNPAVSHYLLILAASTVIFIATMIIGVSYRTKQTPQNQQPPTPTPTKTPEESISDWKTYTNQSLGFEFEYPSSWFDAETNTLSTSTSVSTKDGKEINNLPKRLEVTSGFYYNQNLQREMTLDEWIENQNFPSEAYTTEKTGLDGWQGSRHTYHIHGIGYFMTHIFLVRPNAPTNILIISYRHSDDVEYKSEMPKTLNQILSTFQFMN